ncbi:CHAT domain-containing protein [Chitinophaga caseinilytica]|uniref:CHAT domain-containing protein n=1 Tax=Chitinophaga caseinilytica TaxID=2267521 RepID=A0ABZ2Z1W3_9BACT
MVPMILAAFADAKGERDMALEIDKELEVLRALFTDGQKMNFRPVPNATFDSVIGDLAIPENKGRITIFHYAGHAKGKTVHLLDRNVQIDKFAGILNQLPHLQLVFLNGCNTDAVARDLIAANIKAVIVTQGAVDDTVATAFAKAFYTAYYNLNTLADSFEFAKSAVLSSHTKGIPEFKRIVRGIDFPDSEATMPEGNVYSLYVADEEYLQKNMLFELQFQMETKNIDYKPCVELVKSIASNISTAGRDEWDNTDLQAVRRVCAAQLEKEACSKADQDNMETCEHVLNTTHQVSALKFLPFEFYTFLKRDEAPKNEGVPAVLRKLSIKLIRAEYENLDRNDDSRSLRILSDEIIKHLPFLIGQHLHQLVRAGLAVPNSKNYDDLLLRQLSAYNVALQLLSFSMLNCFLDELMKRSDLQLEDGQWEVLRNFITSGEPNNALINSPALLVTIRKVFENAGISPFIEEYRELHAMFPEKGENAFENVHLFMQGLKASLRNGEFEKLDKISVCERVEEILIMVFSSAGFLMRYKLTTVKDVEYSQRRSMAKPQFWIRRIILDGADIDGDYSGVYANPLHNYSVVFARDIDRNTFRDFMSLSPFIIDENGLKGNDAAKLYFFSHSSNGSYVYRSSNNMEDMRVVKSAGTYLDTELGAITPDKKRRINERMKELKNEIDFFKDLIIRKGKNAYHPANPVQSV